MQTLKAYVASEGAFLELAEEIGSACDGKPVELVRRAIALVLEHLPKEGAPKAAASSAVVRGDGSGEALPTFAPKEERTAPARRRARPPERKGKPASRNMSSEGRVVRLAVEHVEAHGRVTVDEYAATGLQRGVAQQRLETAARAGKIARGPRAGEFLSLAEAARASS